MDNVVLVVEDNSELLEVVESILSDAGWRVHTSENATKGLVTLKEHGQHIALLLTDVVMPDMSGVELATRARDAYPHIKVLLMTGYTDVDTGGRLPLLRKPFRRKQLIEAVDRLMTDVLLGRWC